MAGMATVYKAKDNMLNRLVAVKILRDEFTTDQEFIKRFEIEAQAAASISHPNIVSVYDVGSEGALHYIVMELIQGKTLKEIILEENGALPWKWSINIAIQIASALEVAHKNNIVHRDIKPHNIIITEDGVAKVTDFGIAKAVSNSTITAFGSTIGSVHYFSPEHAKGGITNAKSDLYSLGVVLYEMLTGKLPFDADTPVSVALKHMQEEPVEPKEVNPNIPLAVNDIIMKALRKDANLRYANSTAMLKDLRRSLKEPDGDFVDKQTYEDFATQKISTIYDENIEEGSTKSKKDNKFIATVKKHKFASAIIGIMLVFFLSFGTTGIVVTLTSPKIDIPNLVGKELEVAKEEVNKLSEKTKKINLAFEVEAEEFNDQVEAGKIISQNPEKGTVIKKDATMKVVVSKGQKTVVVPKVTGKKQEDAQNELTELELKVEIKEEESKKVEAGYVIEQSIEDGTEVNAGDTITLTVSTGTKKVNVTSVIGKKEDEAKKELEELGLTVTVVNEEDSSKENGIVLKQSIDVGKEIAEGSNITITVNKVEAEKTATINIDVTGITGGYETSKKTTNNKKDDSSKGNTTNTTSNTTSEETTTEVDNNEKYVTVELKVDGNTVFTQSRVDKNMGTLSTTISGKGNVRLTLNMNDGSNGTWARSYTINLNNETSYTFK